MKLESEEWELAVTQCHDQTFLVTCRYEKCVREIVVRHNPGVIASYISG